MLSVGGGVPTVMARRLTGQVTGGLDTVTARRFDRLVTKGFSGMVARNVIAVVTRLGASLVTSYVACSCLWTRRFTDMVTYWITRLIAGHLLGDGLVQRDWHCHRHLHHKVNLGLNKKAYIVMVQFLTSCCCLASQT